MNDEEFNTIVHKYRDEPAGSLEFLPSVARLIDTDHCKHLTQILHSDNQKWERKLAVDNLHTSLPTVRGVYMFVWRPHVQFYIEPESVERPLWILYVGKAVTEGGTHDNIKCRYQTEYSRYVGKDPSTLWSGTPAVSREGRLSRFLTLRPLEYWFLAVSNVRDISVIERQLIRVFRPPLNRQHRAVLRPGQPQPAF